jgi:3-oxoacyl-[acyl-carrier protein] reductase
MNCIVTGASRGIGFEVARHLVLLGHRVAITGRDPERLERARRELSNEVLAIPGDTSHPAAAKNAVEEALNRLGSIELLINNAGITGPIGQAFTETSHEAWWQTLEVNLRGPMLYMHSVLPHMLKRESGTIINMGSYAALFNFAGGSSYSVSKSALARLTDAVASEIEGSGVTIFCTSPGLVRTDMTRDAEPFKDLPPEAWSPPSAVCELVLKLIKPEAAVLHGRFLHVNDDIDSLISEAASIKDKALYKLSLHGIEGLIG